jgi:hypothetical protein
MRLDRNVIFPENLKDGPKKGKANKPFTVITTPKKEDPPVSWNHCRIDIGTQLIRGFLCEHCGPTIPGIRIINPAIPYEKEKKSS